jgi:hypothetical protein
LEAYGTIYPETPPIHQKGGVMLPFRFIRCLAVCLVLLGAAADVSLGAQSSSRTDRTPSRSDNLQTRQRQPIHRPADGIAMPAYSLTVRVTGDRSLAGRQVTARVVKGGHARATTAALNAAGQAVIRFDLGSVPVVAEGRYFVKVEKGPEDHAHYASEANYCFAGTTPTATYVQVDAAHRNPAAAFTVNIVVAWDRHDGCW